MTRNKPDLARRVPYQKARRRAALMRFMLSEPMEWAAWSRWCSPLDGPLRLFCDPQGWPTHRKEHSPQSVECGVLLGVRS